MGYEELLAGADWKHAPADYRRPHEDAADRGQVVFEIDAPCERRQAWEPLRATWLALPPHPNIMEAVAPGKASAVVVRFAAIEWTRARATPDEGARLAAWGAQIAQAYAHLVKHVPPEDLGRFCRPRVHIDLGDHARVAFLPCGPWLGNEEWPAELRRTWPRAHATTLVHVIGTQIAKLASDIARCASPILRDTVALCTSASPTSRPPSPLELWRPLAQIQPGDVAIRSGHKLAGWTQFERGMGWLATGYPLRAVTAFETALDFGCELGYAQIGRAVARAALGEREAPWRPLMSNRYLREQADAAWRTLVKVAELRQPWEQVVELGAKCEAQRAYIDAIRWYHDAAPCLEQHVALARCYAAAGEHGRAVDYAQRALLAAPGRADLVQLLVRARLAYKDPIAALRDAESLLAATPDDGTAHYLRGKCLLVLGRTADAHAAFDRACTLSPQLQEAMLLRREAIRTSSVARAQAGSPDDAITMADAEIAAGDLDSAIDAAAGASDTRLAAMRMRDVGG